MPPRSKVAQLPPDLRAWLHRAIVERGYGDIVGLTEEINALCKQGGVAITIGKSAIGAESQRVKRAQESIAATTEAARLIAESSPDEGDNRSAAAMAMVQSEVFGLLLKIRESDELDDMQRLAVMNEVALALSRLSRSRVNQAKWASEVEARAKAAADKVARIAKTGGLTPGQVNEIRAQILGVSKRTTADAPPPQG